MLRKFLILCFVLSLSLFHTQGYFEDFYLETDIKAEKILADKLNITLKEDETGHVNVQLLPHGADDDIFWEISPAVATLTQKNYSCTLKAHTVGDAVLTARTKGGLSFNVRVQVVPKSTVISLVSDDKIKQGESATIYAKTEGGTVSWRVDGISHERVSFGGNLCKISPEHAGMVTVSATLDDTTVTKNLEILPTQKTEVNLSTWGMVLAWAGTIILLLVLIYGRSYESKA